jgi:hypothetical protein
MNHVHSVGFLGRVISSSQGLYLHRTTQHRKTRTNIHALSGIRTRDPVYGRSRPTLQTGSAIRKFITQNTALNFSCRAGLLSVADKGMGDEGSIPDRGRDFLLSITVSRVVHPLMSDSSSPSNRAQRHFLCVSCITGSALRPIHD